MCRHYGLRCSPETLLIGQSGAARALQGAVNVARGGPACSKNVIPTLLLLPAVTRTSGSRADMFKSYASGPRFSVSRNDSASARTRSYWRRAVRDRHTGPSVLQGFIPDRRHRGHVAGQTSSGERCRLPELVSDGVTGYVIPVGDQPRFDARLLDLLGSGLAAELGRASRLAAERRSSAAAMAGSLADVFVNLAKQRRGSRRRMKRWRLDRGVMEALHQRYPSAAPCRTTGSGKRIVDIPVRVVHVVGRMQPGGVEMRLLERANSTPA